MSTSSSGDSIATQDGSTFQNSFYIGMVVQNILYGIELLLYITTIQLLLTNSGARKRSNLLYTLFSSMMLFLITLWVMTEAIFGKNMWLLHSHYPGGHDAYWRNNISSWYMDWGMTAVIVLQLMTDALMIYRCWIIWNNYRVIAITSVLWLTTLALGLTVDSIICSPGGKHLFTGVAAKLGLAYYTISVFLNTTLTCLICYYIMRHAQKVKQHIGHEHASLYFTIIAIIVESVFPYTLSGIAFLVSLGMGGSTSSAFMCVYVMMMCISPQMLILRVIKGSALNRDTFKPVSTIKFNPGTMTASQPFDNGEADLHPQTLSKVHLPDGRGKTPLSPV